VTVNRLANGVRASYSLDKADHITRLANINATGTTLSSFGYLYNAVGNRTRVVEANGDRVSWVYDKTYQLTAERRSGTNSYAKTYTYDAAGNRTRLLDGGSPTTSTYDAANQLTRSQAAAGYTTSTYDGAGNLLKTLAPGNQRTSNTWDGENRLTKVALPSGIVNTMAYNGDGQRVQKQDSSGTTKHVWDEQNIVLETDGSNVVQVVYTLEPVVYGNLISQRRSTTTSFYLFDVLGSTRQLTSSAGAVTDSYLYDSFGNQLLTSGAAVNTFRYVGRVGYYFDADIALFYIRSRNLSSTVGRFISRDVLTDSENAYSYGFNNPIGFVDPSGWQPAKCPFVWAPGSGVGPGVNDKYCSLLAWLTGSCCTAKQLAAAKACCQANGEVLEICSYNRDFSPCDIFIFSCKKSKWKGSCKARGTCPPHCGVFRGEGDTKRECERNAFDACVAAGCNTPGGKPFSCQCGHARCVPAS
jgi:RHS repeat-associated protein